MHVIHRLICCRHGSRLDAADKQWHLTSPVPYDPPLTYSGWRQSHALGARIATILHNREAVPDLQLPNGALKHTSIAEEDINKSRCRKNSNIRRRRHKVIIHTSPFLRCIQTSVGISGGMAEAQTSSGTSQDGDHKHAMHSAHPLHSGSPRIRAMDHLNSPRLSAISEPEDESGDQPPQDDTHNPRKRPKPHLRVDAFLGEWLSPGYYEDITHPPDSRLMVAAAKANLLHEKNYSAIKQNVSKASPSTGNFPGGWGSEQTTVKSEDDDPLGQFTGLKQSLPRVNRSGSHSSAGSLAHRGSFSKPNNDIDVEQDPANEEYMLPIPSYAISPLAPIPSGYVAYAKAACLNVDYQWDSMRSPHEWGDGGEFGEEWSAMHKRLRHGLQEMISWYRQHDNTKHVISMEDDKLPEDDDDEDTDTVLIIVTHSAGCNALIGALTNQPVLLDAGLASLTMAIRKPATNGHNGHFQLQNPPSSLTSPVPHRRRSSVDGGVSEDYDVKIIASTDHLRSGSLSSSRRSSRASSPVSSGQRFRSSSLATTASAAGGDAEADGVDGIGLLKRSATSAAPRSAGLWSKPIVNAAPGLWSKPVDVSPENKRFPEKTPLRESTTIRKISVGKDDETKKDPSINRTPSPLTLRGGNTTQQGLWGAPPSTPPSEREKGPKRRWTLHEH